MNISKEIKKILIDSDMTLTQLAKIISDKKRKHYTIQNLSQKLKNNTINADEIDTILAALNYKIYFLPKD